MGSSLLGRPRTESDDRARARVHDAPSRGPDLAGSASEVVELGPDRQLGGGPQRPVDVGVDAARRPRPRCAAPAATARLDLGEPLARGGRGRSRRASTGVASTGPCPGSTCDRVGRLGRARAAAAASRGSRRAGRRGARRPWCRGRAPCRPVSSAPSGRQVEGQRVGGVPRRGHDPELQAADGDDVAVGQPLVAEPVRRVERAHRRAGQLGERARRPRRGRGARG